MQRGGAGAAQYGRDASQYKQLRTLVVAAALRGVAGSLRARWLVGNRFWWARVERNSQGDGRPAVVVIPTCGTRVLVLLASVLQAASSVGLSKLVCARLSVV